MSDTEKLEQLRQRANAFIASQLSPTLHISPYLVTSIEAALFAELITVRANERAESEIELRAAKELLAEALKLLAERAASLKNDSERASDFLANHDVERLLLSNYDELLRVLADEFGNVRAAERELILRARK